MYTDWQRPITEAQRREMLKEIEGFKVEENSERRLMISGEKGKLEQFLDKHKDLIDRGLIAAPGSVVVTKGGTKYDVGEDGSWRKRRCNVDGGTGIDPTLKEG